MKKRKNLVEILASVFLACCCAIGVSQIKASDAKTAMAETASPSMTVEFKNLSYADSLYILYAVSNDGFDRDQNEIQMLFWNEPQTEYALGTEDYAVRDRGSTTLDSKDCLVFYSDGIAAKEMTDDIYARACATVNGVTYYSETVKYSVLEYVYQMREKGGLTEAQENLFDAMLDYGAAAQVLFNYNTDRLANATYYKVSVENGVLPDGTTMGRYLANETVTLRANAAPAGKKFSHWVDGAGNIVSNEETAELTVSGNETYSAVYACVHTEVIDEAVAPTCTQTGLTQGSHCSTCGEVFVAQEIIPATGVHTYENSNECSGCGYIDTQYFTFTLLDDATYSIRATLENVKNMPARVVIPSVFNSKAVTSIGNNAFYYCSNLTSIAIPDSVTSIGSGAFNRYGRLTNIYITDIAAWCDISGLYNLVNSVSKNLYLNNELVKELIIPDGVTSISDYAFADCAGLTSVVIPDSVTSIGGSAFSNCSSLTGVYITDIAAWCNIPFDNYTTNPLYCAKNLYLNNQLVTDLVIPESVTSIGSYALAYCYSLTSVVISDSMTSIGYCAFYNCSNLTSVVIGGSVTSIGSYAFYYCSRLTSVVIPDSVTSIGECAFGLCESLTSVVIGDSVTSIGDNAFYYCYSLTSVEIGDDVTSIGEMAFYRCESLTSITFSDISTWYRTDNSSDWENKTSGTETDLTDPSANATYFKDTYYNYYWYKE